MNDLDQSKICSIYLSLEWICQSRCSRWRYSMDTPSALLALCEWNPLMTGDCPHRGSVKQLWRFFVVSLNNLLKKELYACDLRRLNVHVTARARPGYLSTRNIYMYHCPRFDNLTRFDKEKNLFEYHHLYRLWVIANPPSVYPNQFTLIIGKVP